MKKIIRSALIAYACIACSSLTAHFSPYTIINPAQEKVRIIFKQLEVTYNWLDTIYGARERFYLSGIALDYMRKQKEKCKTHKECSALINKLEAVLEKLHALDLSKKEFEEIRCAAQPLIQLPLFATKSPAMVVA